jgi:hypothetical protein
MTALSDALGSGDTLKTKVNSALVLQGLEEASKVTVKSVIDVSMGTGGMQTPLWALVVLAASGAVAF